MDLESTSNEATKLHYELFSLITWFPRKFIWIKTLLNIVIEVWMLPKGVLGIKKE